MEQTIESYIINSTMYSVVPQTTGGGIWVKSDVGENAWGSEGLYIGQLAGMLSGEVVGEEVVNGVEAYKVAARVDAGKLVDLIMASQDMEAAGLTPEDADALAGQLADSVRSADATIWLRKSDSLPVKFSGDVALSIDLSGMSAGMAEGSLDISAAFSGTVDYDSAVDVKLPASAAAAIDAGGLYGLTACGDGLCEAGEDASSCPLDCGADENGCLSGEFWCESTQSCISLAVGMPLDVACPPV
jgi:hypothetical protein